MHFNIFFGFYRHSHHYQSLSMLSSSSPWRDGKIFAEPICMRARSPISPVPTLCVTTCARFMRVMSSRGLWGSSPWWWHIYSLVLDFFVILNSQKKHPAYARFVRVMSSIWWWWSSPWWWHIQPSSGLTFHFFVILNSFKKHPVC